MKVTIVRYTPFLLSYAQKTKLAEELHDLFNWFQPNSDIPTILKMIANNEETTVLVARQQSELVGFLIAGIRWVDTVKVFYLSGVLVDSRFWGQGIANSLLAEALEGQNGANYLAAHTQNPAIYHLVQKQLGNQNVYPQEGVNVPTDMLEIACAIDGDKMGDDLIMRNMYGNLREDRSYLSQESSVVGHFFQKYLTKNDAFFIIARIP